MITALLTIALFSNTPVYACAMQDAAVYKEAATKVAASTGSKASFNVEGMTCGDCSTKLTAALTGVDGVVAAAVDYQTGEAVVAFDASKTNVEALLKVINKSGYEAEKVS